MKCSDINAFHELVLFSHKVLRSHRAPDETMRFGASKTQYSRIQCERGHSYNGIAVLLSNQRKIRKPSKEPLRARAEQNSPSAGACRARRKQAKYRLLDSVYTTGPWTSPPRPSKPLFPQQSNAKKTGNGSPASCFQHSVRRRSVRRISPRPTSPPATSSIRPAHRLCLSSR